MLEGVYGDHVHHTLARQHMDGGITDDMMWQGYHNFLVPNPSDTSSFPSGASGRHFISGLVEIPDGVIHNWNSDRLFVYLMGSLTMNTPREGIKGY
jgi:hypothetical protein